MTLKMVAIPFGDNTVTAPLPHEPHAFVDITIGVDHPPLTMWFVIEP
jgi:hypothetical protein